MNANREPAAGVAVHGARGACVRPRPQTQAEIIDLCMVPTFSWLGLLQLRQASQARCLVPISESSQLADSLYPCLPWMVVASVW